MGSDNSKAGERKLAVIVEQSSSSRSTEKTEEETQEEIESGKSTDTAIRLDSPESVEKHPNTVQEESSFDKEEEVVEEESAAVKPVEIQGKEVQKKVPATSKGKPVMTTQTRSEVTDYEAAMQCLVVMQREFGDCAPWPHSPSSLNSFIKQYAKSSSTDVLALWIRPRLLNNSQKIGQVRKSLLSPLILMGVVVKVKSKLSWNHEKVKNILLKSPPSNVSGSQLDVPSSQPSGGGAVSQKDEAATKPRATIEVPKKRATDGVRLVETSEQLESLRRMVPFKASRSGISCEPEVVAVDCEGVPDDLFLVQVGTLSISYVFDCVKLGSEAVCEFLADMLGNKNVIKLFHDLHNDVAAFGRIGGIDCFQGTFDTQLAMEFLTGNMYFGFNQVMQELGQVQHGTKKFIKSQMNGGKIFAQRPLPRDVLQYAVDDVRLLRGAHDSLWERLGSARSAIQRASDQRANMAAASGGARCICFDVPNSYAIASYELLLELRPDDIMTPTPLVVSNDTETLLAMLPEDLSQPLKEQAHELSDVVLDKGRRPHAWIGGSRRMLGNYKRIVGPDEISAVVERLGGFGTDNRAGLERQLHRISAIRNREAEIIGLTLRFGRHVSGNANIISDLLFCDTSKSILFLGEPGSGKTTVVREATRLLAERSNVCIVDTSNEIAGDGDIPHPCVGFARRMMVPSLDQQSAVMIECVQNHTPDTMVIDEIGRATEVEAALTCKNRGVRLIASAHGDLRKLIKNTKLRGLIGGMQTVTLGDAQAKEEAKKNPGGAIQKTKAERAGPPVFDILVELKRGAHHEWRIVLDSGDAVDRVLRGEEYKAQRRTRDPDTGAIHLDLEMA